MVAKNPSTGRTCRCIKGLTIDPGLHHHQWMRWRVARVLHLQVVVTEKAPVSRMLESAGPAQRRSSSPGEDDGWPGGSAEVQEIGVLTIRVQEYIPISLACRARTTWHRGAVASAAGGGWRWLEIACRDEDLTPRHRPQVERRSSRRSDAAAWNVAARAPNSGM
jgi:hypothetical protein